MNYNDFFVFRFAKNVNNIRISNLFVLLLNYDDRDENSISIM